jgi:HKD family nuclease
MACFGQSGGQTINSAEDLKKYLDSQPANSPDKPIKISMSVNAPMLPKIVEAINSAGKYVNLNLSGNALTTIPEWAFSNEREETGCDTLVGITIPNSGNIALVDSIG